MRVRFRAWDFGEEGRRRRFEKLLPIHDRLVTKSAGDVERALEWMEILGERHGWFDEEYGIGDFVEDLRRDGRVERVPGGGLGLSGKGERMLRERALERIFGSLRGRGPGDHATPQLGGDGESGDETRPFRFGDGVEDLAWSASLRNAWVRAAGSGTPLTDAAGLLREDDLEIRERERATGCATVLLVDVSHSMILYGEDRMLPAREVALALFELVRREFRKDTLDLVLFGDEAVEVPLERIPYVEAGPFHTNTKAGLRLAQQLLRSRRHVDKQIFMITDGKPSAIDRDGGVYKNPFGLDEEIVNRTLDEAVACRRAGIPVTTFMVARDPQLVEFVEEFTRLNQGRAYFTGTDGLAETLLVDWIRNRRTRL